MNLGVNDWGEHGRDKIEMQTPGDFDKKPLAPYGYDVAKVSLLVLAERAVRPLFCYEGFRETYPRRPLQFRTAGARLPEGVGGNVP